MTSPLARLEALLKRLVGPAQLGRHDEPPEQLRREAAASRSAHEQAWETVVDSSGRRYVRARRAPGARAEGSPARPAVGARDDAPPPSRGGPGGPTRPGGAPR
ncbi:hypothetical protein [uncultured Pseudokineococcus sp.]|uniref:hypothetical protein n=1 Tax=uncultured Pseudokineococcus sp. TaxID=1642928 RepID=UPI002618F1AB|nr:hypothetical protein [uncultured Pseudokineococcus sp.]